VLWWDINISEDHAATPGGLKMEASWSSETMVTYDDNTWGNKPEDLDLDKFR
jgi:hypothetical protein